jgi:hypothetical protein
MMGDANATMDDASNAKPDDANCKNAGDANATLGDANLGGSKPSTCAKEPKSYIRNRYLFRNRTDLGYTKIYWCKNRCKIPGDELRCKIFLFSPNNENRNDRQR